jgi:hypothetical protein
MILLNLYATDRSILSIAHITKLHDISADTMYQDLAKTLIHD